MNCSISYIICMGEQKNKQIDQVIKDLKFSTRHWGHSPITVKRSISDDPNSPWSIKIALEPTTHNYHRNEYKNYTHLSFDKITAIKEAAGEIERACNIKFKFVWHHEQRDKANIRFYQAQAVDDSLGGTIAAGDLDILFYGDQRDIIIASNSKGDWNNFLPGQGGYETVLHEILHALGMSHPKTNGYTRDTTIMSYNHGENNDFHLRPFDVATLQSIYGKPQSTNSLPSFNSGHPSGLPVERAAPMKDTKHRKR